VFGGQAKDIEPHWKGIRAAEGSMSRQNLWKKSVPRVELDQRARDARLQLDRIERLAVPRLAGMLSLFGVRSIKPSTAAKPDG
jgi:hypothetical protein